MHDKMGIPHFIARWNGPRILGMKPQLLILILSLFGISAKAQLPLAPDLRPVTIDLERIIIDAQKQCPKLNCPEQGLRVVQMSGVENRTLGKDKRAKIKALGVQLAEDLWPDTILEGPFEHAGRFRLDLIEKLMLHDALIGYRITYSDKAWDLDTCEFDPADRTTLDACETGRIFESAFIDKDATQVFRDFEGMAEYVADENVKNHRH